MPVPVTMPRSTNPSHPIQRPNVAPNSLVSKGRNSLARAFASEEVRLPRISFLRCGTVLAALIALASAPLISQTPEKTTPPKTPPPFTVDRDPVRSPDPDTPPTGPTDIVTKEKGGFVLRSEVEEVSLNVTVLDSSGHLVQDLKREGLQSSGRRRRANPAQLPTRRHPRLHRPSRRQFRLHVQEAPCGETNPPSISSPRPIPRTKPLSSTSPTTPISTRSSPQTSTSSGTVWPTSSPAAARHFTTLS